MLFEFSSVTPTCLLRTVITKEDLVEPIIGETSLGSNAYTYAIIKTNLDTVSGDSNELSSGSTVLKTTGGRSLGRIPWPLMLLLGHSPSIVLSLGVDYHSQVATPWTESRRMFREEGLLFLLLLRIVSHRTVLWPKSFRFSTMRIPKIWSYLIMFIQTHVSHGRGEIKVL